MLDTRFSFGGGGGGMDPAADRIRGRDTVAHELATIGGQTAMAYLDHSPWHDLGQRLQLAGVPADQVIDHAIAAAKMDWLVGSEPMFTKAGVEIPGYKLSVRYAADGSIEEMFAPVGSGYVHSQNLENVAILRTLAEDFGCAPASIGALNGGRRCWILMRMADADYSPLPGDDVRGYFLMHWQHDGDGGIQLMPTDIRVVCQNTLSAATGGRKAWLSIRHTSSVAARRDEAARLVKTLMESMKATHETFAQMAAKMISAEQLDAFIQKAIPNTDAGKAAVSPIIVARRDTVARLVFFGRGAQLANQGVDTSTGSATVWAALNAVTEYYDHVRTGEAQSAAGLRKAQESAVFGGNAALKASAFELARQLVAV